MSEQIERILKYTPAITLICYICGFVVYKSYLLQYGIIETNIINIRFIEAGILYLLIAPFVLATPFITNKKLGYIGSIFTALFAFIIYNSLLGTSDYRFLWKVYLTVIGLNVWAHFIWRKYVDELKNKLFDLTESPLFFFVLIMTSLTLFSIYFKEIRSNVGGGKTYNKVLILKEKKDNIIPTDTLFQTDTLTIIYESSDFIYFKHFNYTRSIRKDLIEGEILIK